MDSRLLFAVALAAAVSSAHAQINNAVTPLPTVPLPSSPAPAPNASPAIPPVGSAAPGTPSGSSIGGSSLPGGLGMSTPTPGMTPAPAPLPNLGPAAPSPSGVLGQPSTSTGVIGGAPCIGRSSPTLNDCPPDAR